MSEITKTKVNLKVATAACDHSGKYTVRVTNPHGEDTAEIKVVVCGQFLSYFVILAFLTKL